MPIYAPDFFQSLFYFDVIVISLLLYAKEVLDILYLTAVPSAHKPKSIVRSQLCLWRKMTLLLFQSDQRSSRSSFMFMSLLTQYVPCSNHLGIINIIYNPVRGLHTVCLSSNPFYIGSYYIKKGHFF